MNNLTVAFPIIRDLIIIFFLSSIFTFFHEIGHAVPCLFFGKKPVLIKLGNLSKDILFSFSFKKLHIEIHALPWFLTGCVSTEEEFTKTQSILISLSGPLTSIILSFVLFYIQSYIKSFILRQIILLSAQYNCIQFLVTIFPIQYSKLFGSYEGYYSDGYTILQYIKKKF